MIIECYEVVFLMLEMRKASSQLETKLITLLSHNYLHLLSRNSFVVLMPYRDISKFLNSVV